MRQSGEVWEINKLKRLTGDEGQYSKHGAADPSKKDLKELTEALSSVDEAISSNTFSDVSNESSVRSFFEEMHIKQLNDFIANFSKLTDTLGTIFTTVGVLDSSCDSMLSKLSIGQRGVDEVLDMTTSLYTQQEKQRSQLSKIHNIIEEYYLSDEDLKTLENGDVNDKFFESFARLEASQERTALAITTSQARCLADASSALNQAKERAFQRIYHWLHLNAQVFARNNPTIPSIFNKCISTIKAKTLLYSYIVVEIAKNRNEVLSISFSQFLGQSKRNDVVLNIEPLVYTSDILAWVHQASATESAFLLSVFQEQQGSLQIQNAMSTACEAFCTSINKNVSQIIESLFRPSDIYQITNILSFYFSTFNDLCGIRSPLAKVLGNLKQSAIEIFKKSINESCEGISGSNPSPGAIKEALRVITDVTALHKKSSLSVAFDVAALIDSFAKLLLTAIKDSKDSTTFQANALYDLLTVCKEGNLKCVNEVKLETQNIIKQMVEIETMDILHRCRIYDLLKLFKQPSEKPLSMVHGGEENYVRDAIKRFESTLVGAGRLLTPKCEELSNPQLRKDAKNEVSQLLSESYETLFNAAMDPRNAYANPGIMFKYTPQLMRDTINI